MPDGVEPKRHSIHTSNEKQRNRQAVCHIRRISQEKMTSVIPKRADPVDLGAFCVAMSVSRKTFSLALPIRRTRARQIDSLGMLICRCSLSG